MKLNRSKWQPWVKGEKTNHFDFVFWSLIKQRVVHGQFLPGLETLARPWSSRDPGLLSLSSARNADFGLFSMATENCIRLGSKKKGPKAVGGLTKEKATWLKSKGMSDTWCSFLNDQLGWSTSWHLPADHQLWLLLVSHFQSLPVPPLSVVVVIKQQGLATLDW